MANNEQGYNGYPNYETWAVNLWLTNDPYTEREIETLTRHADSQYDLAQALKEKIEEENPLSEQSSMYTDLLNAAISEVRWDHLASNYWENYKGDEEEEEE